MRTLLVLIFAAFAIRSVDAQPSCNVTFEMQLLPSDRNLTYEFGHAISASRGIVAIGMPHELNRDGLRAGAASIFETGPGGHWSEVAKIHPPFPRMDGFFGSAIAATRDAVFVAEPNSGPFGSHVYAFERRRDNTWRLVAELEPEDRDGFDDFGWAVAAEGDKLLVGAPDGYPRTGFVTVIQKSDGRWREVVRLSPDPEGPGTLFGWSIAMDGPTAVIAAKHTYHRDVGLVYVYEVKSDGTWVLLSVLDRGFLEEAFGESVAVSGNRIAIAAPASHLGGRIYFYEKLDDEWVETERIQLEGSTSVREFESIALVGDHLFVGWLNEYQNGEDAGMVRHYAYEPSTRWTLVEEIFPPVSRASARFGEALATSEGTLFVGAPGDVDGLGSAYAFDVTCVIELSTHGDCPGVSQLICTDTTPTGSVAFLYAPATGNTELPRGLACAGTSLDLDRVRMGRVVNSDASGDATIMVNVPSHRCGTLVVQAIDLSTCSVSNVVAIR